MRLDVYQAKVAARKNLKDSGEWDKLSPEQQRLIDKMVSSGRWISHLQTVTTHGLIDFGWNSRRPRPARGTKERIDGSQEGTVASLP